MPNPPTFKDMKKAAAKKYRMHRMLNMIVRLVKGTVHLKAAKDPAEL